MEAGEDFTIIDVRKPEVWGQSDTMIPEAIRIPLDNLDENRSANSKGQTDRRLLHLTERRLKRQFGAETSAAWLPGRMGTSGRIPCMAGSGLACGVEASRGLA